MPKDGIATQIGILAAEETTVAVWQPITKGHGIAPLLGRL